MITIQNVYLVNYHKLEYYILSSKIVVLYAYLLVLDLYSVCYISWSTRGM